LRVNREEPRIWGDSQRSAEANQEEPQLGGDSQAGGALPSNFGEHDSKHNFGNVNIDNNDNLILYYNNNTTMLPIDNNERRMHLLIVSINAEGIKRITSNIDPNHSTAW